ncbi:MAG: hypothetical protein ACRDGM_00700 [bacterium]
MGFFGYQYEAEYVQSAAAAPAEEVGRDLILRPWKSRYRRFYPYYAFYPQDIDAALAEHTSVLFVFEPGRYRRFFPYYAFFPQDFDAPAAPEETGRDLLLRPWVLRRTRFYPYYQFFPQDTTAPTPDEPGWQGFSGQRWQPRRTEFYPYYVFFPQDLDAPAAPTEEVGRDLRLRPWVFRGTRFFPLYLYPATDIHAVVVEVDTASVWTPKARPARYRPYFPTHLYLPTPVLSLVGITKTCDGSAPLGGVTVKAFRTSNDTLVGSTVSDVNGNFSIVVADLGPYYLVCYFVDAPDLAATTVNTLVPS